jgi:hypothetical protein
MLRNRLLAGCLGLTAPSAAAGLSSMIAHLVLAACAVALSSVALLGVTFTLGA